MSKPTRRRFLQAAAASAALPLIVTPTIDAGDPPPSADASLTAIVRQRYKHLTEDQIKTVQAGVRRNLAAAETLKRIALTPVDEPATIFVADVAE
jgi:hypothetical protein